MGREQFKIVKDTHCLNPNKYQLNLLYYNYSVTH